MSVLSVSAVRKRVQDQITTSLSAQGWRVSRFVPELFARDTDQIAPRMFSVGVLSTRPIGDRQRVTTGTVVETMLSVRFCWRLRADNQVQDYDSGLDAEEDLCAAVMSTSLINLHLRLDLIPDRQVFGDGNWFLGNLIFRAQHRIPLT